MAFPARLRFRWIFGRFPPPFGPFLARFWPEFWQIWTHFRLHFGLFLGPLRGPVLSENIRKTKRFEAFWPPKKAQFRAHFGPAFRPVLDSIFGLISGRLLGGRPNPISRSLGAGLAGPWGGGVKRFSPRPWRLKGFLKIF